MHWVVRSVVLLAPVLMAAPLVGQDWYEGREAASRQVLVKFKPGEEWRVGQAAAEHDIDRTREVGRDRVILMHSRSRDVNQLVRELKQRSYVQYAEPDYILRAIATPNDPYFTLLWGLQNTGQTILGVPGKAGADIGAAAAWDLSTGSSGVVVGVVDTGVDYNHQDLQGNIWSAPAAFTVTVGGVTVTCPAGSHGYNAITNSCSPLDDNDHGTHVSGTIGARGNNVLGVTGVNWTTSIMGLKFLDKNGSGYTSDAIDAIEFAIQAKAVLGAGANVRVLSNSWGGGGFSQALLDEIIKANTNNMLFVAAAGNNGRNNDATPSYPASYAAPNVVAVAAVDNRDQLAGFSNYGASSVHLGAPGVSIASTIRNNAYAYYDGTSMATPHVSGAAALVLSKCGLTTASLRQIVLANVVPIAALAGKTSTGGRLNVNQALRACAPPAPDFSISATPVSTSVARGGTASYTVSVGALSGFAGVVGLSVTGLPGSTTAAFTPASVTGSGSSTLAVVTSVNTPGGTYTLTVTGTSGALAHSTTVTLVVTVPTFTLAVSPASTTVKRDDTASYSLQVTASGGFNSAVGFSVTGQPAGSTVTFKPATVTGSGSSVMGIGVPKNATAATYTLVVTASGGGVTRAVNATLVVKK